MKGKGPKMTLGTYVEKPPSKRERQEWREIRLRRVEAYLVACEGLKTAIVAHAGDFLLTRGERIGACANRPLPPEAKALLRETGPGFAAALKDALPRVPWLRVAPYLRGHAVGDTPPIEVQPIERIVEGFLEPLRTAYGLPLHPMGGAGAAIRQQPLASESWPQTQRVRRCVISPAARFGFEPRRELAEIVEPHPALAAFREVARCASQLDALDLKGE